MKGVATDDRVSSSGGKARMPAPRPGAFAVKSAHRAALRTLRWIDERLLTDLSHRWQNYRSGMHRGDYVFSADTIAFVHLPKTGGTSFGAVLSAARGVSFTGLGVHRPVSRICPPSSYRYFTVMRDPVERVWSYYQMALRARQRGGWGIYGHLAGRGLEFFLGRCWEVRNMACRYYSGTVHREPGQETLRAARANLAEFSAVLSFAELEAEASEFFRAEGIEAERLPHANAASYAPASGEDIALISGFNALDLDLYSEWRAARDKHA